MSTPDSPRWTAERQLRFLDKQLVTRSVRVAAAAAGMSREGAYRLRDRRDGALFALLWDRALAPEIAHPEGHTRPLTNGRILRLLGTHFRRERGDFARIRARPGPRSAPDRT